MRLAPYGFLVDPYSEDHLRSAIAVALTRFDLDQRKAQITHCLTTTLNSVSDAIILTDTSGVINCMNPTAERLTGWQQREALGQNLIRVLRLIDQASDITHAEPNDHVVRLELQSGQVCGIEPHMLLITRTGTTIPIDVSASPIRDNRDLLSGFVIIFRDASERKQVEARLVRYALHDSLTGLRNRTFLMERLGMAFERARRHTLYGFAICMLDLDRFKVINDSLGPLIGDQLLVEVARRTSGCLRGNDTIARLGGDEFVILIDEIIDPGITLYISQRIHAVLREPFVLGGQTTYISTSIGIALYGPQYEHREDLLRDADLALYRAKGLGKACTAMFDAELHAQAMERFQMENDLRHALERHELHVHYQPIVELATGKLRGFEALLRWQHPLRGMLMPAVFLTAAEDTGLIIPIGWWVLEEACRQVKAWQEQYPADHPLTISVNLASRQLAQPDVVQHIQEIINRTHIAPSAVHLELTERTIIARGDSITAALTELHALGVRIHLDDFGTGYSSLSALHHIPIAAVKIDRSFIADLQQSEARALTESILLLAETMRLDVVAEGIETTQQMVQLNDLGCGYGQGYYFARGLDAATAQAFVANRN
jgi:diguanylate cyclase (GGDEF)-like protein/PAS domain S-box-containing protein